MESVLQSVSFGKQEFDKKVTYQAFSAAISNQTHVDLVLNYICRKDRIKQAKNKVLAYRVNQQGSTNHLISGDSEMGDNPLDVDHGQSQNSE